jgi:peptidoglycan/LPS O-acetylase OafA/YrhL
MNIRTFFQSLPTRLARVTTGGNLIREVDGLRFLAIFPVVVQHLSERLERNAFIEFRQGTEYVVSNFITNRGFIGVYIFFVISGFILGMPFASYHLKEGKKVSIKSYFLRRLSRLEPPYIIVMLGITILLVVMGYYTWQEILPHFGASILYLHSIIYHSWSYINPPVWTLEIEVQFYILAPLLAYLFFSIKGKNLRRATLVTFILVVMLLQQHFDIMNRYTILTILAHIQFFLIGFLVADIYLIEWSNGIRKHAVFNYLSVFSLVFAFWIWSWDYNLLSRLLFISSLFLLAYSSFRATWFNRFITLPWITAIGGMCYTIYLVHLPIIEFMIQFTKNLYLTDIFTVNFLLQLLILTPILMTVSVIFFLLIEKPCMHKDWPQRLRNYLSSKLGN